MTLPVHLADLRDYIESARPKPSAFSGPRVFVDALAWQRALADAGVRVLATDFAEYRPWCAFVCGDVPVRIFISDGRTEVQIDRAHGFVPANVGYTWIDERAPVEVIARVTALLRQPWMLRGLGR